MSKTSRARATAKFANQLAPSVEPTASWADWMVFAAGAVVLFSALAVYHNGLSGPFILDDHGSVTENQSIRHLGTALSLHASSTISGRPVLNLTFALNYLVGGMDARGYHALNILIHALAGLTLFGIVRRTLLQPALRGPFGGAATPLAAAVAVLWVVHPVQTEAVTYISQRAESLMGLFYLLTLYCFIRGAVEGSQEPGARSREAEMGRRGIEFKGQKPRIGSVRLSPARLLTTNSWLLLSVVSCLLGAMTKEIIATAPVMVLLYDRTFIAGTFRNAWMSRWRNYLGLGCSWLLLAMTMHLKQQAVGFGQGVTWRDYASASCCSVIHYLKLSFWPRPLVFDYGFFVAPSSAAVWSCALGLAALAAGVLIALRWRPALGFAGAWFFLILAPTSSVIPIVGQPTAENRLYLSLAAVTGLVALGLYRWLGRRSFVWLAIAAVGLGWLTVRRNRDYRSEFAIWSDTVTKRPDNARAQNALGLALQQIPGEMPEAMSRFETALRLKPDFAEAHSNLGMILAGLPGRIPDAISHFEAALRINPDFAIAHNNLGVALANLPGRMPEAIAHFKEALRLNPNYTDARDNLAAALARNHVEK
jgi:hypothetical protein